MNYLFDSDIIINFFDKGIDFPVDIFEHSIAMSVVSVYEVRYGALKRGKGIEFDRFIQEASFEVVACTKEVVDKALELRMYLEEKGEPLPHLDLFIAASALVYDLILVTNNKRHFERIPGLEIYS